MSSGRRISCATSSGSPTACRHRWRDTGTAWLCPRCARRRPTTLASTCACPQLIRNRRSGRCAFGCRVSQNAHGRQQQERHLPPAVCGTGAPPTRGSSGGEATRRFRRRQPVAHRSPPEAEQCDERRPCPGGEHLNGVGQRLQWEEEHPCEPKYQERRSQAAAARPPAAAIVGDEGGRSERERPEEPAGGEHGINQHDHAEETQHG